jgi:alginate O-acetyltransferase complex protein AlgI
LLFSSLEFILLFFPLTLFCYFQAARWGRNAPLAVLLAASLFFYAYWKLDYLFLLVASLGANYFLGEGIRRPGPRARQHWLLVVGLISNTALLVLFKYYNFLAATLEGVAPVHLARIGWELPLGISFFTFVQIAYLVDCWKQKVPVTGAVEYSLFVTYFPHLIAGPIVHHSDLMPQFFDEKRRHFLSENFTRGLFLFGIGLCKKTLLADNLSGSVSLIFDDSQPLVFLESWLGALAYTLQLYFDFSGYSDMAMGASLMLNIELPQNFESPYRSPNITEFWRRWHMTLSRWLRDYIYIPLGGSRGGVGSTYRNLFITFLVGGIWHGAGFTFLLWGTAHGLALIAHKDFSRRGWKIPLIPAIAATFVFNIFCWVLFRAKSLESAGRVFSGMLGLNGLNWAKHHGFPSFVRLYPFTIFFCALGCLLVFFMPNSLELTRRFKPNWRWAVALAALLALGLISANTMISAEFLYFDF